MILGSCMHPLSLDCDSFTSHSLNAPADAGRSLCRGPVCTMAFFEKLTHDHTTACSGESKHGGKFKLLRGSTLLHQVEQHHIHLPRIAMLSSCTQPPHRLASNLPVLTVLKCQPAGGVRWLPARDVQELCALEREQKCARHLPKSPA